VQEVVSSNLTSPTIFPDASCHAAGVALMLRFGCGIFTADGIGNRPDLRLEAAATAGHTIPETDHGMVFDAQNPVFGALPE
jgi:hypothetical protein